MARISILMEHGRVANRLRNFNVFLDGQKIGRLRPGETMTADVALGVHTVRFTCGFLATPPVKFVADVAQTSLTCRSNMWRAMGLFALFAPRSWIRVREETDVSLAAALAAAGPDGVLPLQETASWARPLPKALPRRQARLSRADA